MTTPGTQIQACEGISLMSGRSGLLIGLLPGTLPFSFFALINNCIVLRGLCAHWERSCFLLVLASTDHQGEDF